jgi:hypothetical protein
LKWHIALAAAVIIVALFLMDGGAVYVRQLLNRPPKAAFTYRTPTRTLKYIAPTDRDIIMFLNNSTDPDGDPLASQWLIRYNGTGDWKLLNNSRDHWGRLPVSNEKGHEIRLVVSDGMKEDSKIAVMPVDPAYLSNYPEIRLDIPRIGIVYNIGEHHGELPPDEIEISEALSVVKNELRRDTLRLFGSYEDVMIICAKLAQNINFSNIVLNPRYRKLNNIDDMNIEEHTERLIKFSQLAERLRKNSIHDTIVLSIGNELTIDVRGICNGTTYLDRIKQIQQSATPHQSQLNSWLKKITAEVRKAYKGKLTYSAAPWESVKWNELDVDIVGANQYYAYEWMSEKDFIRALQNFKSFKKPVGVMETGSATFEGARRWGGGAWTRYQNQSYSQKEQAEFIRKNLILCSEAKMDIVIVYTLVSRNAKIDETSYGVLRYHPDELWRRKEGFYSLGDIVSAIKRPSSDVLAICVF